MKIFQGLTKAVISTIKIFIVEMTAFGSKIAIHQPKITIFRSKITKNGQVSNKIYLFIIITVIFNYYRPLEHI